MKEFDSTNNTNNDNNENNKIRHSNSEVFQSKGPIYEAKREYRVYNQVSRMIYYILGVVEFLLLLRLLLKLLGANSKNLLVSALYSVTGSLTAPFAGIFNIFSSRNADMQFVFEPSTIMAMIIYAAAARGIVGLIRIGSYRDT